MNLTLGTIIPGTDGREHHYIATRQDGMLVTVTRDEQGTTVHVGFASIAGPSPRWKRTTPAERQCSEHGCWRLVKARGLCETHYKTFMRRINGRH